MAEPEVGDLDKRLAHDFARLGFRASEQGRRSTLEVEPEFDLESADPGAVEDPAMDFGALGSILGMLDTVVRRLDWIDASMANLHRTAAGDPEGPTTDVESDTPVAVMHRPVNVVPGFELDVGRQLATLDDRLARIEARLDGLADASPSAATEAALEALTVRFAALGEPAASVASADDVAAVHNAVRRLSSWVAAVGDAVAASAKQVAATQQRLTELGEAFAAMQRGLGV